MKILLSFWAIIVVLSIQPVWASDDWPVPDQYNSMENPVAFNNQNVRAGRDIYEKNCRSCHGDPGKYNALAMVPPPPDAASEMMQENSDGQLFYKITIGRGAMPQFETTLSSDDRWKVITYIRRFDPRNAGKLTEEELLKGKIYALVGNNNTTIDIVAEVLDKSGDVTKLVNTPVFVQARKTFGNLLIGSVTTDAEGRASFAIPPDMQVKSDGKVDFILTLGDDFEPVIFSVAGVQVKVPEPYISPSRVLWSTNDRTQIWLLFTYFAALLGAWTIIGYIIVQIFRIREPGGKDEKG
jgi:mono/diheme cytochrome c family protein